MRQVLCPGCRRWFDGSLSTCPECDKARPGFNKSLRTAQLNNHLYGMAEQAEKERKRERAG